MAPNTSSSTPTNTTSRSTFTLKRPNNSVATFTLIPGTNTTRITLPPGSTWSPSPHWHEAYTEYVRCISGRLLLRLNGDDKIITADDGPQVVNKGVVHEFMRADVHGYPRSSHGTDTGSNDTDTDTSAEDVVVEEWTDPSDGMKHVFFRNLFSILEDHNRGYWGWFFGPQILLSLRQHDNWNVLWGSGKGGVGWLGWGLTHAVYGFGWCVARSLGLKAWYREYVPEELWGVATKYS